jgi:hypothetical protein
MAYALYNAQYDNETYQSIQVSLVTDLYGAYYTSTPALLEQILQKKEVNTILNTVTDVALELCQHPDMVGKREKLLSLLKGEAVSVTTICRIGQHLENFEAEGSTFSADFENLARTGIKVKELLEPLYSASQLSTVIHGKAGNAAHELIHAAYALLRAAELVLFAEPSTAYIQSQIRTANLRLEDAQRYLRQPLPVKPYQTLVLSADGMYPGIVTEIPERLVRVRWYKWGYDGEVFTDWLTPKYLSTMRLTAEDCEKRFGALPPEYQA